MIVLGSTGSIGVNTLEIARAYNIKIDVLVAGYNAKLVNIQAQEFKPRVVVVATKEIASLIKHPNVIYGKEAIIEEIHNSASALVVNALVGFLGLAPTIESIKLNKKVALANKESLVIAGKFINIDNIIPIDSEHFALEYILDKSKRVKKMTITASGGALRDFDIEDIHNAGIKDVLAHPNWSMGDKITVDSASMCNKLFELMEVKWLFGIDDIDAIIEPSSTMHGLIEYGDGSVVAHLASSDMKLPIAYALLGKVDDLLLPRIDLLKLGSMSFKKIDTNRYKIWSLREDVLSNMDLGVVVNRANEEAVSRFLASKIAFGDIFEFIQKSLNEFKNININTIEDIYSIDKEVVGFINTL